jgi:hypothetical protein
MAKDYILRNMDPKLWQQVKMLAVKKGITIRELILELLKREVKNQL